MFNSNIQRTQKTYEFYKYRGMLNWYRAARELEIPPELLTPSDFMIWIDSLFFTLRSRSRRVYLASLRTWLNYMRVAKIAHGGDPKDLDDAIEISKQIQSCDYKDKVDPNSTVKKIKKPGKTSSHKEKSVDLVEFFNMEDELEIMYRKSSRQPRMWTEAVLIFMYANILVGLRPCEWRRAYLDYVDVEEDGVVSNQLCLILYNAKNTNERSHGEKRHLVLTDMDEFSRNMISKQLNSIKDYCIDDKKWAYFYNAISRELRKMTRQHLFREGKCPTYPTVYSTRHQFAANAKLAGFSDDQIAAMMGHATDLTASLNYAKKHMGTSGFCVKPIESEVAKIRHTKVSNRNQTNQRPRCRP